MSVKKAPDHRLLRESEDRLRAVFASSLDSIITMDHEGKIVEFNPAAERTFGHRAAEVVGREMAALLIPARFREGHRPGLARYLATREGPILGQRLETTGLRADGTEFPLELTVTRLGQAEPPLFAGFVRDITERKLAEEALERSERRHREAVARAPIGIYQWSRDGRYLEANPAFVRMLGYSSVEEVLRLDVLTDVYLNVEDRDRVMRESERRGGTLDTEVQFKRKDGTPIWVELQALSATDDSGQVLYYETFVRDITQRRQAGEALSRLAGIVESSEDAIVAWSRDGRILSWNAGACKIYGYSVQEALGRPIAMLVPLDRAEEALRLNEKVERGEGIPPFETVGVRKDGSRLGVSLAISPIRDSAGEVVGASSIARDITERLRSTEALDQLRRHHELILVSLSEGILGTDVEGRITFENRAAAKMLGYPAGELIGKLPHATIHHSRADGSPNPAEDCPLQAALREGVSKHVVDDLFWRKDGSCFPVEYQGTPLRDAMGVVTGVVVAFWDVTASRQIEARLRMASKMEAVGQLAGGIAHDFNNILTAILGYSEVVLSSLPPGAPEYEDVEEIRKAGARAAGLTRQLLAFSSKQILEPKILDLNALIENLENMLRRIVGESIRLLTRLDENLGSVRADPGQLEQIVVNLSVNARDAMPEGGRLLIETANVDLDDWYAYDHAGVTPGPYTMLVVSDTGIGMGEETLSRVFEPFFTTKARGKGTGLGLATVYGIVKQSHGSISVDSKPGKGTRIKIFLPRYDEAPAATPQGLGREGAAKPAGETVLLVEDEPAIRALARKLLARQGYRVIEASGPEEALEVLTLPGSIDLLLTDVVMPGGSGTQLAARAIGLRPDIRVLYMSGYTDSMTRDSGGPDSPLLQKPFTPESLARKVREVLAPVLASP